MNLNFPLKTQHSSKFFAPPISIIVIFKILLLLIKIINEVYHEIHIT